MINIHISRYFILLSKRHASDEGVTPLTFTLKLLNVPDVNESVSSLIIEMLDNLLTVQDDEADVAMATPLSVENVLCTSKFSRIVIHCTEKYDFHS